MLDAGSAFHPVAARIVTSPPHMAAQEISPALARITVLEKCLVFLSGGGGVEGAGLVQALGLLHRAHGSGGPPPSHAAADQLQR